MNPALDHAQFIPGDPRDRRARLDEYATGDTALARRTVLDARARRIAPQIAADGSQPQELARTRSRHYSAFDLVAYTRLAAIGRHVGVDLWDCRGPEGAEPVPGGGPPAAGRDRQRRPAAPRAGVPPVRGDRCGARGGRRRRPGGARAAVPRLQVPPGGDLWALRPAAEQLDSITG
ncbi:hypothetical protein GCM10017687_56890 [Streptomyces echinatus]|uniref:Alginate lyase domain-containing protein n=1 Tax=Streptomyces echinatus TaxID=67293 RepID=A0A7W9Q1J4_9ACTN|nr:alginate lyase family protein [Streptomyces echinatus]MBB5931614.1 hypothetical protein [Streptomyces echinatus]